MNNSKKIILISIIVLIVLILLGGIFIFLFSDIFKSNQELFNKYISKNSEIKQFFEDEQLDTYHKKQKEETYNNNGEITINISGDIDEENKEIIDEIAKNKITFSGNVDSSNKYIDQNVNLNYNGENIIGGVYVHQDDYYGIKVSNIIEKFITIENNNLKEFATKLGITDVSYIPNKITASNLSISELFTEEEIEELKQRYSKVFTDNLNQDMFSKKDIEGGKIYTLSINEEQLEKIANELIETLKNDELAMSKIKEIYIKIGNVSEEEAQEAIDELKQSINNSETENEDMPQIEGDNVENQNIDINVYVSKGKLTKTEIASSKSGNIEFTVSENQVTIEMTSNNEDDSKTITSFVIDKEKADDYINYKGTVKNNESETQVMCNVTYTGLSNMTNIEEKFVIDIYTNSSNLLENTETLDTEGTKTIDVSLAFQNKKTFGNITKQELNENNMYKINDKTKEQLTNMFTQLGERISKKVTEGYQNSIMAELLSGSNGVLVTANQVNDISEQEIQTFNAKFTSYEGTGVSSSQINYLIQTVITSNQAEITNGTDKYVKITFPSSSGATQEISVQNGEITYEDSSLQNKVTTGQTYTVTLNYANGVVNEIVIK